MNGTVVTVPIINSYCFIKASIANIKTRYLFPYKHG